MKQAIILLAFLCLGVSANAQSVKVKKGTVYIDDQPFLTFEDKLASGTPVIMKTMSGHEAFTFLTIQEKKYNPDLGTSVPDNTYIVEFIDFEAEMNTKLQPKKLLGKIYSADVINDDGAVNQAEAEKFVRIYDQDIPLKIKIGY